MKLDKKINVLFLGLGILLAACGKDKTHQNDPAPENRAQRTCQIIEMTTATGPNKFTYNSTGKLIERRGVGGYNTYSRTGNTEVEKIFDSNNNRLTTKRITVFNSNNSPDSHTETYYFTSGDSSHITRRFQYNSAGQLMKSVSFWKNDSVETGYNLYSYPAADQVTVTGYARNPDGSFILRSTWQGYFDNMKNPYLNIGVFKEELLYSKNNVVKAVLIDHKANTTQTGKFSYNYNEEGFAIAHFGEDQWGQGPAFIAAWKYNCQ